MLPILVCVGLLFAPARGGDGQKSPPSAEAVERAGTELDEAFRANDVKRIEAALEAAQSVSHASVVRKVARGLDDERPEVVQATLQALRWLEHPDALETLHRTMKEKRVLRTPELVGSALRAIGQHADPRSVAVLARDPFEPMDYVCLRARLFGLGRIRTRESLAALIGILGVTGPGGRDRRVQPQMEDARLALMVLTGLDQGSAPENWERWWRANEKTFELPAEPPLLPKELRVTWDGFWGLPIEYERDRRREDRGKDPERPRKE